MNTDDNNAKVYTLFRDYVYSHTSHFITHGNCSKRPDRLLGVSATRFDYFKAGYEAAVTQYKDDDAKSIPDADKMAEGEAKNAVPKVCGNCLHGKSTALDDTWCYVSTPYLPTGRHCIACSEWEPCSVAPNPKLAQADHKEKGKS